LLAKGRSGGDCATAAGGSSTKFGAPSRGTPRGGGLARRPPRPYDEPVHIRAAPFFRRPRRPGMGHETFPDERLLRLPLPLAQLYRRALNAKSALERHQAGYYLWEAALKLLASVAVVEYAEHPEPDPELAERLENLARPSVGHWWEFVRRLLPVLADGG